MSQESKVEIAKKRGALLRGTIGETLASEETHFQHDDQQLLKFHGTYQQDDRDQRISQRKLGLDKYYQFMVRCTLPAGILSASQYLALDQLADQYADGTLRITTRQSIQFHGVIKNNLRATIAGLNDTLVTTLAACGDVQRNVMACAAPLNTPAHQTVRRVARDLGKALLPETRAYHEIWLDGEKTQTTQPESESFYGDTYLPRKFKTGVTLDGENSIDVYSYDAGLMGVLENDRLIGFNVLAGGGLGMSHGRANTFAQLAHEIAFVEVDDAVAAIKVVGSIYRDFGNRENRKQARLKYLIDQLGLDRFLDLFHERANFPIQNPRAVPPMHFKDYLGAQSQGDGKFFYGIFVQSGRVKDTAELKLRTALRTIVQQVQPQITLTAQQSILLTNLSAENLQTVRTILESYDIEEPDKIAAARRYSMACPALPTCGVAVAESERIAPAILAEFETVLTSLGLRDVPITIRFTGCPNGCARPYTADIAFVGRRPGVYHLYVGGGLPGNRIADLFAADVKQEDAIEVLRPLLEQWADQRTEHEGLGDFYQRILQRDFPRRRITGKEKPTLPILQAPTEVDLGAQR